METYSPTTGFGLIKSMQRGRTSRVYRNTGSGSRLICPEIEGGGGGRRERLRRKKQTKGDARGYMIAEQTHKSSINPRGVKEAMFSSSRQPSQTEHHHKPCPPTSPPSFSGSLPAAFASLLSVFFKLFHLSLLTDACKSISWGFPAAFICDTLSLPFSWPKEKAHCYCPFPRLNRVPGPWVTI